MTYDPLSLQEERIAPQDRQQAEASLRQWHREGRITAAELDQRLGQVFLADSPLDLTIALQGPLPQPSFALSGPVVDGRRSMHETSLGGALAHFSPFVLWLFGPLLFWAVSPRGSNTRREAAKAFNFQLVFWVASVVIGIVAGILLGDASGVVTRVVTALWVVLTIIGGVKAAKGVDWTNPVRRVAPWEVLSERQR